MKRVILIVCSVIVFCGAALADSLNINLVGVYHSVGWDGSDTMPNLIRDFCLYDNYLFMARQSGYCIVDVSNPSNIVYVSGDDRTYNEARDASCIAVDSLRYLIVGRGQGVPGRPTLLKYDISDPFNTVLMPLIGDSTGGVTQIEVRGQFVYALYNPHYYGYLVLKNLSDFSNVASVGTHADSTAYKFTMVDTLGYIATKMGVRLVSLGGGAVPRTLKRSVTEVPIRCWDITSSEISKNVYMSRGDVNGLSQIGLDYDGNYYYPSIINRFYTPGMPLGIAMDDGTPSTIYVADSNSVRVIDRVDTGYVTNGFYDMPLIQDGHHDVARQIKLHNGYIYVRSDSTMYVFQYSPATGVTGEGSVTSRKSWSLSIRGNSIHYNLDEPADVKLTVYNLVGQQVRVWEYPAVGAGEHTVQVRGLASGIYLVRLEAGATRLLGKMVFLK